MGNGGAGRGGNAGRNAPRAIRSKNAKTGKARPVLNRVPKQHAD